jgi:hypothetical protein
MSRAELRKDVEDILQSATLVVADRRRTMLESAKPSRSRCVWKQ